VDVDVAFLYASPEFSRMMRLRIGASLCKWDFPTHFPLRHSLAQLAFNSDFANTSRIDHCELVGKDHAE
jgi:hypothetical protein